MSPRIVTALIALALAGAIACKDNEAEAPVSNGDQEWVEDVALDRFASRQTLYGLGEKLSEHFGVAPIITTRDPVTMSGPEGGTHTLVEYNPMSGQHRAYVFNGQDKVFDRELNGQDRVTFSHGGGAVAIYQGLEPPLGDTWTEGTDVQIYRIGVEQPVIIPRGDGVKMGPLLDDGSLFIVDGPGHFRHFGPDGKLLGTISLDGVNPEEVEPGEARSRFNWLLAQKLIAVYDYTGPSNRKGDRILSGIRMFSMVDGALVATYPKATKVIAGAADQGRYFVLEKPGKLVTVQDGKRGREGYLPGRGSLAISPNGDWVALTSTDTHLWLYDTGIMSGIWEHTSPEPWNVFMPSGTRIGNSGRVFGARRHQNAEGRMLQMQLFTLDADGSGKVLLERPYKDATFAPVWIVGASDAGKQVIFGALGEELRIVSLD